MSSKAGRTPTERDPVPDVVYHATSQQGLRHVLPHISLHRQPWVYATTDIHLAALFVSKEGSDLSCATGLVNGELYVYERWGGAFDVRYLGRRGSIYELPGKTFQRERTSFLGEVVSEVLVPVLRERRIPDVKAHLLELQRQGHLRIFLHHDRPHWIPRDDQDLVDKVVAWSRNNPNGSDRAYAERNLPHLAARIGRALAEESLAAGSSGRQRERPRDG